MASSTAAPELEQILAAEERSLRWLALKLDLDPGYVWKMVRGVRPITDDFRTGAARVLGRPIDELFPEPLR